VLLLIVRHGAHRSFHFLRQTFAGEPVHIMWDRRLAERRGLHRPRILEARRGDRRVVDSPISLSRLPFIAVPPRARR
jgi:hypothetical protein